MYRRMIQAANLLLVIAATLAGLASAGATQKFDLSPDVSKRVRAERDEAAIRSIGPGFKFATPGRFTVAITPWQPPDGAFASDARTIVGAEPDLAVLIADALGVELNLVPVAWEDWPLGVTSGKYDAVISNVTVTEQRKQKYDFSSYRRDVLGFYVKADSRISTITEPKDVAGLRIITSAGTNAEKILQQWDRENVAGGLKPIELQYFDDNAAQDLAIQSGRADVEFNSNAGLAYRAAIRGDRKQVGIVSGGWPLTAEIAVVTRKNGGLADAVTIALNTLIANGKYGEVLKRWNVSAEAVDKAETNPPGLPGTDS